MNNQKNKIFKARELSLNILVQVIFYKKYSNKLLSTIDLNYLFLDKDLKLIYKIVYGTLQNKLFLEYIINNFINPKKTNKKIQILLWLSLYQLHFLDKIPPYAIVNEAVDIAKNIDNKFGNFVNAVLNKLVILDNAKKIIDNSKMNEIDKLLLIYSIPKWIFSLLVHRFSNENVIKYIKDNVNQPKLSYRVNTNKINYDKFVHLFSKKHNFISSDIIKCGIISSFPLIKTSLFYEGYIIAQDEMAQKISEILNPNQNDVVLDMCAAPGGKTTHLSQLMNNKGKIDAFEINSKKIELLKINIKRLKCKNINVYNLDVNNYKSKIIYDKILLDPPCSGLGVLKRKPEIKYIDIKNNKIDNLIKNQLKLLETAFNLLKKNGILLYSTCTVNYYENQGLIKKYINLHKNMKIIDEAQIFGFENNTDGFYYCKLIKI